MTGAAERAECEHCGMWLEAHDHEHLARECYPKRIEKLEAVVEEIVQAADVDASQGGGGDVWVVVPRRLIERARAALGGGEGGE